MKKVISRALVSALSTLVLVGCGVATPSPESHSGTIHDKELTQEKVHHIIKKAGEEAGWIMTEFKNNAILAEKICKDSSTSVTVTFNKSSFDVSPSNSDLEGIISDALGH